MKLVRHMAGLYTSARPRDLDTIRAYRTFALSAPYQPAVAELGTERYRVRTLTDSDLSPHKVTQLEAVVAEVVTEWGCGDPALVHCRGGRNRSCLVAALVMRDVLGLSGPEALERVRRNRPGAIANPAFERYLMEEGWKQ